MIRNVVIHLFNEQPLLADIESIPDPSDTTFVCTNLRTMNGTRPVFIDRMESTFVFPYAQIRFLELPRVAAGTGPSGPNDRAVTPAGHPPPPPPPPPEPEAELEIDEDFLRRVREV